VVALISASRKGRHIGLPLQIMPDKKIKAVLFDLGETLLDFGKVNTGRLFLEGAKLSYDFLKLSNITKNDFNSLALLRDKGTKKGIHLDKQQWQHFAWLWYEPLSKVATTEPKIKETLTELKNSELKLGIVSNTFVNGCSLEKHLEQVGILDFFTVRIYSYEFDFRKPDARIFKVAAEKIGEMMENILFVGDRIDKDIRPAIRNGMHTALKTAYTNAGKKTPRGAWRINQLSELPGLIEKINAGVSAD